MKENELYVFFHPWKKTLKALLAMKIILFLTCIFAFTLQASVFPQGNSMSIEAKDKTIRQICNQDPTYLEWVLDNIDGFELDDEAMERLSLDLDWHYDGN